jgi:hypothetical protein
MSSILEALRELEEGRARDAGRKTTSVADAPREPESKNGAFIPLTGGLSVGVVVFGLYLWGSGFVTRVAPDSTLQVARPDSTPPASGPAWLDRAETPRARVTPPPGTVAPPAQVPAAAPPSETAAALPLPKVTHTRGGAPSGQIDLESISYSPNVDRRSVTLRVNGQRGTLRERESIGGVEVQLIMSDGVYLQRGSDVFFVAR